MKRRAALLLLLPGLALAQWVPPSSGGGAGTGSCLAGNYVTAVNPGVPTCAQVQWGQLGAVPGTFPPSSHQHAGGDVTSAVANATNASNATGIAAGTVVPSDLAGTAVDTQCPAKTTGLDTWTWTACGGGGGAPATATYITQTADAGLSAEQALSALGTGLLKSTTGTGVLSIAVAGDLPGGPYEPAGTFSGVGACGANTWASTLSDSVAPTCTQPAFSNLSGSAAVSQLPDATTLAKGIVQLAGDLGGTAASPSVSDDSHAHTGTTISALDAGDTTTGTFAAARIPAATSSAVGGVIVPAADCNAATTAKVLYTSSSNTFSCGTDQTGGGGGAGTKTMLTAAWASSATANTLGIIGTGATPLTSPTISANTGFGAYCRISTTRPATTNGPRYGVTASQTLTRLGVKADVGLAGTAPTSTYNLQRLTAVTAGTCTSGCTSAITTGTLAQVLEDEIRITGVMGATQGTVSLQMAPSAGAANTAQAGSFCIWY